MRALLVFFAILLVVPALGAAALVYAPAEQEQLVEGHTVFTVIQVRNATQPNREEFAAAVAVLVRENVDTITYPERFPGVLWFNDQYLVEPSTSGFKRDLTTNPERYPCGAVIAVNAGDPLPQQNGVPVVPPTATYVESYRITDPNDQAWDVDKWSYDPDADPASANSFLIWSVATLGSSLAQYGRPDDGVAKCSSQGSKAPCGRITPFTDDTGPLGTRDEVYHDSGAPGRGPPYPPNNEGRRCIGNGDPSQGAQPFPYNAVLFFFLNDLTDFAGVKDHRAPPPPGVPPGRSERGCHVGSQWPCPNDDDNREGYSHGFMRPGWPHTVSEGRGNHGGSKGCGAGDVGGAPQYQHATCNVDIYFGYVAADTSSLPAKRATGYRVFDAEGATAPYHCHDEVEYCNEEDVAPGYL